MSRGPGRWQRLLLHEVYHNPNPPGFLEIRPSVRPHRLAVGEVEESAIFRAARVLAGKGLVELFAGKYSHTLYAVEPRPELMCPMCGLKCSELVPAVDNSEHLEAVPSR